MNFEKKCSSKIAVYFMFANMVFHEKEKIFYTTSFFKNSYFFLAVKVFKVKMNVSLHFYIKEWTKNR